MSSPEEIIPLQLADSAPVFVLNGAEYCTPTILNIATYYYKLHGAPPDKIMELVNLEKSIEDWQSKNPHLVYKIGER